MPTVLRVRGFRFAIYTDDHAPAHVHAYYGGGFAVINLGHPGEKAEVREWVALSRSARSRALAIANAHQLFLLAQWRSIHGKG